MGDQRIILRNAMPSDIPDLVTLLETLFSIESDFAVDREKQYRGVQMLMDGCGKHRCVIVAEMNGRVIGMSSLQAVISTAEGGLSGLVEDVIIDPAWRRKGIGTRLLQSLDAWAKEHGLLRLQLLADKKNTAAIAFYRSHGWKGTDLICQRKML